MDAFGALVLREFGTVAGAGAAGEGPQLSLGLAGLYVGLHLAWGVAVGLFAGRLPARVERAAREPDVAALAGSAASLSAATLTPTAPRSRRPWWGRAAIRRVGLVAVLLVAHAALLGPQGPEGPAGTWSAVALAEALRRALGRQYSRRAHAVAGALALFPKEHIAA